MTDSGRHSESKIGTARRFRLGKIVGDTAWFIGGNLSLSLAVATLFFAMPAVLIGLSTFAYRMKAAEVIHFSVAVYVGFSLFVGLLGAGVGFLGHAVLSQAVLDGVSGGRPSIASSVRAAFQRTVPVLGIGLTIYLLWFCAQQVVVAAQLLFPTFGGGVAFLLAVVPCIVWVLGSLAAVPAAMREGLGAMASIRRSRALTKGYRWPIFGLFLILLMLILALRVGLFLGFDLALMTAPTSTLIVNAMASAVVTAILWTVASVAATAIYVDLRQAKEGGGVDELAEIFS